MTADHPPAPNSGYTRRQALATGGGLIAGCALGGLFLKSGKAAETGLVLRPPGALPEDADFLAACIRCGQCVQVCPYDTLHLEDLSAGLGAGAPAFHAATNPCWLCEQHDTYLCIEACPTNALQPIEDELDIDIGEAHICKGKCWAYNGTICRSCWHACPFPNEAIYFDELLRPVVNPEICIGCGLCVHACPTDSDPAIGQKAVTITPREFFNRQAKKQKAAGVDETGREHICEEEQHEQAESSGGAP